MTYEEAKTKIETDADFIYCKRFNNSLEQCLDRYPDGAPEKVIAQSLMMTEEEVRDVTEATVQKLRKIMKVDD